MQHHEPDQPQRPKQDDNAPIPDPIVEQAIEWLVTLNSGMATAEEDAEFTRWYQQHPEHARAWQRMQHIGQRFSQAGSLVDSDLANQTLHNTDRLAGKRRRFIKTLVWLGVGGSTLHIAQQQVPWRSQLALALADEHTSVGEQRTLTLADGTIIMLNTATAIDIAYTSSQRTIQLRQGEIMVQTSHADGRPFTVATSEGLLTPIGTRFTVRRDEESSHTPTTLLSVLEGAVQVQAKERTFEAPTQVNAGQKLRFSRTNLLPVMGLAPNSTGWLNGQFIAVAMPLDQFITELGRYHPARLRCAPAAAQLRITGVWPLSGPDAAEKILQSAAQELPIRIRRVFGYWITVSAR